jgi:hypothetical protein
MGPSVSLCLSRFSLELSNPHDLTSLLEHTVTMGTEAIVGTRCCNNENQGNCWGTLLQGDWDSCRLTTLTSDHIGTMILETIVAFVIPFELEWPKSTALLSRVMTEATCWFQGPSCGVKNTFGISVYSKEYTFPVLFSYEYNRSKSQRYQSRWRVKREFSYI